MAPSKQQVQERALRVRLAARTVRRTGAVYAHRLGMEPDALAGELDYAAGAMERAYDLAHLVVRIGEQLGDVSSAPALHVAVRDAQAWLDGGD